MDMGIIKTFSNDDINLLRYYEFILHNTEIFKNFKTSELIQLSQKHRFRCIENFLSVDIHHTIKSHFLKKLLKNDEYYYCCNDQIKSKLLLTIEEPLGHVLSVGSWYGQHLWFTQKYKSFTFNEINDKCCDVLKFYKKPIIFDDMMNINYNPYDTVINTSCEHIELLNWLKLIPTGTLLILQSTDFECDEHINTHNSLIDFIDELNLSSIEQSIEIDIMNKQKRFHVRGIK